MARRIVSTAFLVANTDFHKAAVGGISTDDPPNLLAGAARGFDEDQDKRRNFFANDSIVLHQHSYL